MTKIDIQSNMFLRNLMKVMAGKKFRLYTFRDYLELQHTDNDGYSVIIKEDSWKGVNLFIEHKDTVHFEENYITETRLLNAIEESLKAVDGIINNLVGQIVVGKIETYEETIISDIFLRKLKLVTFYLGATVEQGWGVNVKNPKGSILILPSSDVRGVKLAVYDNEDREIRGWANYREENSALKAVEEILTTGVLGTKISEDVQEDVTMVLGGLNFGKKKFSDSLVEGLKEIAEEYGVTFKQTDNYLFLDNHSGEGYVMVFTTGGNRLYVNTVLNGQTSSNWQCHHNNAVFSTVRASLENNLGIKPKAEEEPKPKYANLEMMKRSKDFIIVEEGDEILVDFVAFHIPYYATIKDGEVTYSINVIDAEDEHIKLDMDKINQLKEVCEFIIG